MNQQIEQAIQYRDNYQDYIASLPASIYNNNIEIYQANLERMNQEIDRLIEEAEAENEIWKMNSKQVEETPVKDMKAFHNFIVAAEAGDLASLQYGDKWLGELPSAKITTLQGLADAKERSFNRRYYNNPNGEPKFVYRSNR